MRSFIIIQQLYFKLSDRRLLPWLLVLLLLLAGAYIYLLHNSVYNLQAREQALEQMVELETKIAVLESSSMAMLSEINLDLAVTLGFAPLPQEPLFAERSEAVSLSLLTSYDR